MKRVIGWNWVMLKNWRGIFLLEHPSMKEECALLAFLHFFISVFFILPFLFGVIHAMVSCTFAYGCIFLRAAEAIILC